MGGAPRRPAGGTPRRRTAPASALIVLFLAVASSPPASAGGAVPPPADPFTGRPFLQARALRGLSAPVAAAVLTGQPGGEIALAVLALPWLRDGGDKTDVRLFVEIDGATFLSHNPAEVARVEVYAYALAAGAVAAYSAEAFAVPVAERGEAIWQSGLKVYGRLEVVPGRYDLRVLVRNAASGAWGLVAQPLEVPASPQAQLLFPDPRGRDAWLPVRGWSLPQYPFAAAGEAVLPSARPVLVAGRRGELYLAVPEGAAAPGEVRLELLAAAGEAPPVATLPLTPAGGGALAPAAGSPALLPFRFQVPELAAGEYRARLTAVAAGGKTRASPQVRVSLAPAGPQERELLWTDLRWQVAGGGEALAGLRSPEPEGRQRRRGPRRRLRRLGTAYRQALAGLDAGLSAPASRNRLLDLESTVLGGAGPKQLALLQTAELAVAEELAARDAASLLPLISLHHDLYLTYRGRRLFALAAHAMAQVEILAERYAAGGGDAGLAARALAVLGGYQQEALLVASSRRLFLRALAHDPASSAALLGLAASGEKYGEYAAAVELLERLVEAHPDSAEGWLRLAVNLRRMGAGERARAILSRAAGAPGPAWVQSLTCEELARALIQGGRLEAAEEVLERGLESLPEGTAGPRFLLAHVYDLQGRYRQALALLEEQRPGAADGAGSPRRRYDAWPREELAAARRDLVEAAAGSLPALGRALDGAAE